MVAATAEVLDAQASPEAIVPVEEYLTTMYRPDRDYVDGVLLERNVGERPHGTLQGFFTWFFRSREDEWKYQAIPEQRVQVAASRFRIPDVCLLRLPQPDKRIVRSAPIVCIEVLSEQDRMSDMQEKVDDYLRMGVQAVWIIDPWRRKATVSEKEGVLSPAPEVLTVQGTPISVPVTEIFKELDRYGL